jgi:hypothetical protein
VRAPKLASQLGEEIRDCPKHFSQPLQIFSHLAAARGVQ